MLVQNRRLPEGIVALAVVCTLAALVGTAVMSPRVERLMTSLRADGLSDTAAAMVGVRQLGSAFA